MKKIFALLCLIASFGCIAVQSQAQEFKSGDNVLSLGLGLGSSLGGGYAYSSQSPAISIQYEHGQWDVGGPGTISLGGYLGFKSFSHTNSHFTEKWSYTVLGFRSAYHFNMLDVKNFDLYAGAMLSYNIVSYSFDSHEPFYDNFGGSYGSALGLSIYIGGRYYFSQNIGAFLELGYGISYATIGGSFKF